MFRLVHQFPYTEEMTRSQKQDAIANHIAYLKNRGYAGIVSNVPFAEYLESEANWGIARTIFEEAKKQGMRAWLYDERGYPSGGAGGITLRDHPECEAQAVAELLCSVKQGESVYIAHPRGHREVLAVFGLPDIAEPDMDAAIDLSYALDAEQNLRLESAPADLTVAYYARKPFYEGTHAQHNVFESRRYIDVSSHSAVAAFARNTYDAYFERLSDLYGNTIEAMFTDEPSYMGGYINKDLYPPVVRDAVDPDFPLYPSVNWGDTLREAFREWHGYDIVQKLPYLFHGEGESARAARLDFYSTLSKLYEMSYFAQLSHVCEAQGIAFSGHVLLEERIAHHVLFEGNLFSLLRWMHTPGIDILTGEPETLRRDWAVTPKLVSSIAQLNGRAHVMSELSDHAEGGACSVLPKMLCSVALQYALGVDTFHSYYSDEHLSDAECRIWCGMLRHLERDFATGLRRAVAGYYYPIETLARFALPSAENLLQETVMQPHANALFDAADASYRDGWDTLLAGQIDYIALDREALSRSEARDGKLHLPLGGELSALLLPACCLDAPLAAELESLIRSGVAVYAIADARFAPYSQAIEGIWWVDTYWDAVRALRASGCADITLVPAAPEIVYLLKDDGARSKLLFVNSANKPLAVTVEARMEGHFRLCDTVSGAVLDEVASEAGNVRFRLELPPYGVRTLVPGA